MKQADLCEVKRFWQGLRVTQTANFAVLCYALVLSTTCTLSRLANVIDHPQRRGHRSRRLWFSLSATHFRASGLVSTRNIDA